MMFRTAFGIAFLATMLVASAASAQLVPDFDRCNAANPGRYRNQRLPATANAASAPLGAPVTEADCDAAYERAQVCAPTINGNNVTINPGQSVTVTCSGAPPRRPNRRRVSDRQLVHCDESLGAVASDENPNVCVCQPMPGFNAGAPVIVADHVVRERMAERYRVGPHAMETSYGCLYVANGQPRPGDLLVLRILGAVVAAQEQLARRVEAGERHDVEQDARANAQDAAIRRNNSRDDAQDAALRNQFRLQFDGSIGGLVHWNAGSPVGGVGGGGILRTGLVLRWSDDFGLRVYGGWGLGGQTNTPYALPNPVGGAPIAQSAPLHMGVFGIDGLFGSGTVAAIFGIDGFVAGRTAPVVVPGTLSGLLAWRANVHAGARIRLAGDSTGFQMNLDLVVNGGVSNVSAVSAGRLFSPTTFGVGGEILIGVTR